MINGPEPQYMLRGGLFHRGSGFSDSLQDYDVKSGSETFQAGVQKRIQVFLSDPDFEIRSCPVFKISSDLD